MSFTYSQILKKAQECVKSVETKQELGINSKNAYYFAALILNPNLKKVEWCKLEFAPNPKGDYISRQISKKDYTSLANYLVKFGNKNHRLLNYKTWKAKKISVKDYTYLLARILIYQHVQGKLPSEININTKVWTKPTETSNKVCNYFIKVFGKVTTFTDALRKVDCKGYGYYFEDVLSNIQVIDGLKKSDGKKPNCVDVCHMMWNVAVGLGYDVRCLHVYCPRDDITHVRLQVKHPKYTNNEWEDYDPAAVANGDGLNALWCNGSGSYVIATNPTWFMSNVNR